MDVKTKRLLELQAKKDLTDDEKKELIELKKSQRKFRKEKPMPGNDFSYWNKYPELMETATKIPWMHIPGTTVRVPNTNVTFNLDNVLVLTYVSTPGVIAANTDPFNLQIRKTWLDMHRRYRGLGAYQQADLGIILFCVKEIFAGLGECARIYGVYQHYPVENRIAPRGVLQSMGYNTSLLDSIERNLADYLYGVNRLVRKARQLCLPKNLSVLRNQLGLTSFIYKDSEKVRASYEVFVPRGYWQYDGQSIGTGSAAFFNILDRANATTYPTYQSLLSYFENLIDILLTDDDVARVCSDLIACYGDEGTEALIPYDTNYEVIPIWSEEIQQKIHNMEILDHTTSNYLTVLFPNATIAANATTAQSIPSNTLEYLWITQADNTVYFRPVRARCQATDHSRLLHIDNESFYYAGTSNGSVQGCMLVGYVHPLDTWKSNPTSADVCESMLWKLNTSWVLQAYDSSNTLVTNGSFPVMSCSTELFVDIKAYKVYDGIAHSGYGIAPIYHTAIDGDAATALSKFDWHPIIPVMNNVMDASGGHVSDVRCLFGDLDNFTMVDGSIVKRIQDAALLSAFAIDATIAK